MSDLNIRIQHCKSVHEGGTKHCGLVLIEIEDVDRGVRYSRLTRMYGSMNRKAVSVLTNDWEGGTTGQNHGFVDFSKFRLQKMNGGYADLAPIGVHHASSIEGVMEFCKSAKLVCAKAGYETMVNSLSGEQRGGLNNWLEYVEKDLGLLSHVKIKRTEEEQEIAMQMLQQRQAHYGDVLGSW